MPPRTFTLQQRVARRGLPALSCRLFSAPSAVSPPTTTTPPTPPPPSPSPSPSPLLPPPPRARPRRREAVELGFEQKAWFVPAGAAHTEPVDAILDGVAAGEDAAALPQSLFASRVVALAAFGRDRGFVAGVGAARYTLCLEWAADALERPEQQGRSACCGASFRRLADVQVAELLDAVLSLPQHVEGRRQRRAWSARLAAAAATRLPPRYLRRATPLRLLRKMCDATAAAPAATAASAAADVAAASAVSGRLPGPLAEAALARLAEESCVEGEAEEGDALALLLVLQREGCRSEGWQGVYERRMEGAVRRLEAASASASAPTAVVVARLYAALGYVRFAGAGRRGPLHGRLCSVLEEGLLPVEGFAETLARRARGDHGFRTAMVAAARTFGPRLLSPVAHPRLSRFVRGALLREEVVGLLAAADGVARGLVGRGHTAVDAVAALERWAAVLLPATATAANPAAPAEGIPAASVAGMRSLLAAVNLALQRPGEGGVLLGGGGGGGRGGHDASQGNVRTRAELDCLHHEALSLWDASAASSAGGATVESEAAAAAAMPLPAPSKAALRSHAAFVRGVGVRDVLRLRRALAAVLATAGGAEEAARVRGFYRRVEALVDVGGSAAAAESEDGTPGLSALVPPLYAAAEGRETVAAPGASVHAAFERSLLRALERGGGGGGGGRGRRLALDELLRCACVVARFGARDALVWERISEAAAAAAAEEAGSEGCGEAEVAAARPAALVLSRILQASNGLAGAGAGAAAVEGGGRGGVLDSADLRAAARKAFSSLMFVLLSKQR